MIQDKYHQIILNNDDLIELVKQGRRLKDFTRYLVDDTVDAELFGCQKYHPSTLTVEEFDRANQSQWLMPKKYHDLDIAAYILSKCSTDQEIERCGEELLRYQEKNLLDLLKYLVYLVDIMRENNIIWGVGRGSSVSSHVLYLIGVHRINSLEYDLDYKEFLR